MFNWAKGALANVVGTEEPIYGASALESVAKQAETTPYTELTRDDLKWEAMQSTSVETQSFYLMADSGHIALAQVIYSNVVGIHTTCQFNSKIFYLDKSKPPLWCSSPLSDPAFSDDKTSFYANDCALELSVDGDSYTIKSATDARCKVDLRITRTAPGFMAGKDGKSLYGTDPARPWGVMRHAFWPRCVAEGTMTTAAGAIDFKGRAFYAHALQGMKPHHAAARWNFVEFQGPTYSAGMMEFVTPPSYACSCVGVGAIVKDGEIIAAGCNVTASHTKTRTDVDVGWMEPIEVRYVWKGITKHGKLVEAVMEGPLEQRLDRVDIMAEVPSFVKKVVAGTVGTKPFIYQYAPTTAPLSIKLKIGDDEILEQGTTFAESTFISPTDVPVTGAS